MKTKFRLKGNAVIACLSITQCARKDTGLFGRNFNRVLHRKFLHLQSYYRGALRLALFCSLTEFERSVVNFWYLASRNISADIKGFSTSLFLYQNITFVFINEI